MLTDSAVLPAGGRTRRCWKYGRLERTQDHAQADAGRAGTQTRPYVMAGNSAELADRPSAEAVRRGAVLKSIARSSSATPNITGPARR